MKAFRCFVLKAKNGASFLVEKIMERREMIKRKFANLEKALKKVI